jgi:hypothetical protein
MGFRWDFHSYQQSHGKKFSMSFFSHRRKYPTIWECFSYLLNMEESLPLTISYFLLLRSQMGLFLLFCLKGIGSILFLKNGFEKFPEKAIKNHLRSNIWGMYSCSTLFPKYFRRYIRSLKIEICLQIEIGRPSLWSNFLSSVGYIRCQQCIFNFICTWT